MALPLGQSLGVVPKWLQRSASAVAILYAVHECYCCCCGGCCCSGQCLAGVGAWFNNGTVDAGVAACAVDAGTVHVDLDLAGVGAAGVAV
eukprot:174951-Lingulodinium_polyedra.AAC.1